MSTYQDRASWEEKTRETLMHLLGWCLHVDYSCGYSHEDQLNEKDMKKALSELASIVEEERINGARDFVKWGYGDLCETKDTEDFPDMKDDPLANRCASCEEWENFEDWKRDQLSNRSKSDE